MESSSKGIEAMDHHVQAEFCTTRPAYRQGKELKAVKVYTINDESQHLLIHNVPSIGLLEEVKRLAGRLGKTDKVELLRDYPIKTEFTHVYYVKYSLLKDARLAKKKLDNRSFFGSILHVCYAPELETVDECKAKLKGRISSIQKSWTSTPKPFKQGKTKSLSCSSPSTPTNSTKGTWSNLLPSSSSVIIPKTSSTMNNVHKLARKL